jgi:hypothetical protein
VRKGDMKFKGNKIAVLIEINKKTYQVDLTDVEKALVINLISQFRGGRIDVIEGPIESIKFIKVAHPKT